MSPEFVQDIACRSQGIPSRGKWIVREFALKCSHADNIFAKLQRLQKLRGGGDENQVCGIFFARRSVHGPGVCCVFINSKSRIRIADHSATVKHAAAIVLVESGMRGMIDRAGSKETFRETRGRCYWTLAHPSCRALTGADGRRHIADIIPAGDDASHEVFKILGRTSETAAAAPDQDRQKPVQCFQLVHLRLTIQKAAWQRGQKSLQSVHGI